MGVVFTNEAGGVINELYVFASSTDGTDVFEQDMGPDMIRNTSENKRIGSFGVTIEVLNTSYNVMARDRSQGIYIFQNVPLTNVCEAVLAFEPGSSNPVLTIYHKSGAVDVISGELVREGDAPAHTHNPLRREVPIRFSIENTTGDDIAFVSMREAADPDKGEVELVTDTIADGDSASVSIRLYEDDEAITEWILFVRFADGNSLISSGAFNPWETENLVVSKSGGALVLEAE
jgi:hypothetical protein